MKTVLKLLFVPVLALAFTSAAYADDILLGSYGTNGSGNPGFTNSALQWVAYDANTPLMTGSNTNPTYDLTAGLPPWADPINLPPQSVWVSQDPNSTVGSNPPSAPPNGYYTFTSTFAATPGDYYGSIAAYADDTMEIFLNDYLIVPFRDNSVNGSCAQGPGQPGPSCVGAAYTVNLFRPLLDQNTLTIIDWQSNSSAQGVDFAAKLSPVPEPGSLLLLGTGLVGLAKFISRKAHSR